MDLADLKALGRQQLQDRDWDGAIATYTLACALAPDDPDLYTKRGAAKVNRKSFQDAWEDLDRALRLDPTPSDANVFYNRGVAAFFLTWYPKALADFEEFVRRVPNAGEGYFQRGRCRLRLGDDGGTADLGEAMRLDPSLRPEVERLLGEVGGIAEEIRLVGSRPTPAEIGRRLGEALGDRIAKGLVHTMERSLAIPSTSRDASRVRFELAALASFCVMHAIVKRLPDAEREKALTELTSQLFGDGQHMRTWLALLRPRFDRYGALSLGRPPGKSAFEVVGEASDRLFPGKHRTEERLTALVRLYAEMTDAAEHVLVGWPEVD